MKVMKTEGTNKSNGEINYHCMTNEKLRQKHLNLHLFITAKFSFQVVLLVKASLLSHSISFLRFSCFVLWFFSFFLFSAFFAINCSQDNAVWNFMTQNVQKWEREWESSTPVSKEHAVQQYLVLCCIEFLSLCPEKNSFPWGVCSNCECEFVFGTYYHITWGEFW